MARILVHALAATSGGGATYLRNFLEVLAQLGGEHEWLILTPRGSTVESPHPRVRIQAGNVAAGSMSRVWLDQVALRSLIRRERIDCVLATGNFGMLRPPVPQILLNRNPLYFSRDYTKELFRRRAWRELTRTTLRRQVAMASIRASTINVVPTAAFGESIREWMPALSPESFRVIPHGFSRQVFVRPGAKLSPRIRAELDPSPSTRRLLFVSHYNYFRNFETVLRGFSQLKRTFPEPVELILTTRLGPGIRDHEWDTSEAAQILVDEGIADRVRMLGTVPYAELYPLYCAVDAVVCPAFAETFGHPMVEAMASGKPVIAADRGVQREICDGSAIFFETFSPEDFAHQTARVLSEPALSTRLAESGVRRSRDFCWNKHFRSLLALIDEVLHPAAPVTYTPAVA